MTNVADPYIWRPEANFDAVAHSHPKKTSLLAGLRLAVKDLFHIANVPTTAGNPHWLKTHDTPRNTSSVVTTLLQNGAQLVGKTITDELAYSLNGQNMHYGTPINYHAPDRLPGGSSSGSAVAVAQGSADIGLGTDTGGSIRVPASYNGLFGIRPTHNVIAVDNLVALAPGFDTVGWLTRDLATLHDVASLLLADCNLPLQKTGVYFPELNTLASHETDVLAFINRAKTMEILPADLPSFVLNTASESFRVLQGRQIWREHGAWIADHNPTFSPDIVARLQWCAGLSDADEARAGISAGEINQYVAGILDKHSIIILPTTPGPAPLLSTPTDELAQYRNNLMSMTAIAGLGGLPQLHIPLSTPSGLPAGVSLIGKKYSDLSLMTLASELLSIALSGDTL